MPGIGFEGTEADLSGGEFLECALVGWVGVVCCEEESFGVVDEGCGCGIELCVDARVDTFAGAE